MVLHLHLHVQGYTFTYTYRDVDEKLYIYIYTKCNKFIIYIDTYMVGMSKIIYMHNTIGLKQCWTGIIFLTCQINLDIGVFYIYIWQVLILGIFSKVSYPISY
jgi:hypothetical protein